MSLQSQAILPEDFLISSRKSKLRTKMLKKTRFYFESMDINPEELSKVSYFMKREFNSESEGFEFIRNRKNSLEID